MDQMLHPPSVYVEGLSAPPPPPCAGIRAGLWEVMGSDEVMGVGPAQWD